MSLQKLLTPFYSPTGPERVGFILADGTAVEVNNISTVPDVAFDVAALDILTYADTAQGTWHTHPGSPANLSLTDHKAFLNHPKLTHHIVGQDGVRSFAVINGMVQNAP